MVADGHREKEKILFMTLLGSSKLQLHHVVYFLPAEEKKQSEIA
jgi:hypothetical protein